MSEHDPHPPLMSPRSPSYERAREEILHPSPVGEAQRVAVLAALGGSAPTAEASREILSHRADSVARALSDVAIQETLKLMRAELGVAYREAISSPYLDEETRSALAALAPG